MSAAAECADSTTAAAPAAIVGEHVFAAEGLVTFDVFYRGNTPAADETGAPPAFRITASFFPKNVSLNCRDGEERTGPWRVLCTVSQGKEYEAQIAALKNIPPLWWKVIMRVPHNRGDVWGGTRRRIY